MGCGGRFRIVARLEEVVLISPLIDLLIIAGSGFLLVGSTLKAIDVATRYHPSILGFSSLDFLLMTGVCWVFALVLTARTWVQLNEPKLVRRRRALLQEEARWRVQGLDYDEEDEEEETRSAAGGER